MPRQAVAKTRVARSARSDGAEPTPARKRKEEREETLRKVKMRQALHREAPTTQLKDNSFLVETGLFTRKRPAYPAYDDSPQKRRKVSHGLQAKKLARRAPWERDTKLERPFLPSDLPVGTLPRDQDPVAAMGSLCDLPTETRDDILRYLLLWPLDIPVFCGWSRVYPRSRPRLDLAVLYTCRMLRDQGLRILFGENKFVYDLKDPAASHQHTHRVLEKVFGDSKVPIKEHGHLIRHIRIKVDRTRIHFREHRHNFAMAFRKFLPGGGLTHPVNLHTLTLEVPAENNTHLGRPQKEDDDAVPICRYLKKVTGALLKIQIQWVHVLAWDSFGECWELKVDMRYHSKDEQMRLEHIALHQGKKRKVNGANRHVDATGYRVKDVEAMEKLWARRVKNAVSSLKMLSTRIEELANEGGPTDEKQRKWRPVAAPEDGDAENNNGDGHVSLSSNWSDNPRSRNPRPGRTRATPPPSKPAPRSDPKMLTRSMSKTKSSTTANTRAGTMTGFNLSHLRILNAGERAKEGRLLQAQQGLQENGREPPGASGSGMLTEGWLESLPEHDASTP
ncbi:hypothetical protein F4802DRAFT_448979 [Xylaria palmicola]|nr:hypothetical protein F4802DRAFT_448979 [Xylaria palmicola]